MMTLLAEISRGQWMIVVGMLVLLLLPVFNKARRRRRVGVDFEEKRVGGAESRESMDEILLKLQEYSRETLARLDTKMRALNEVIARADAKLAELKALEEKIEKPAAAKPGNPLHEKVFRLSDEGKSVLEIGETTGLQRGEVEMILGLRGRSA